MVMISELDLYHLQLIECPGLAFNAATISVERVLSKESCSCSLIRKPVFAG